MIRISNWLDRPLSVDLPGFSPGFVPAATSNFQGQAAGTVKISGDHYAALLALPSDSKQRRDLALAEIRADNGTSTDNVEPNRLR